MIGNTSDSKVITPYLEYTKNIHPSHPHNHTHKHRHKRSPCYIPIPTQAIRPAYSLQLTLTSVRSNAGHHGGVSSSRSDVLARELGEEAGVRLAEGTGASESVDLADTAEVVAAGGVGGGGGRGEQLAIDGGLDDGVDVLENVALGEDVATRADLEGVTGVVVPVVVDLEMVR